MFKRKIIRIFENFGIGITSLANLNSLHKKSDALIGLEGKLSVFQNFVRANPNIFSECSISDLRISEIIQNSKSQLGQDLIALAVNNFKQGGFFVEFGATDGVDLSNSFLLESKFSWNGILCEPAKFWKEDLITNRNSSIDFDCVWSKTGEDILFHETPSKVLSTINDFSDHDEQSSSKNDGARYWVKSISLGDLLVRHGAPSKIDFLSIDTEGSEFEILNNFDFTRYRFNFISCEHNYGNNREKIHTLLTGNGYRRIFDEFSNFDDWYIHADLVEAKGFV
jgi:FkbM family methyltransferase